MTHVRGQTGRTTSVDGGYTLGRRAAARAIRGGEAPKHLRIATAPEDDLAETVIQDCPVRRDQIELIPSPVYVCDNRGVIVGYNRRAADLWGREPIAGSVGELYCGFTRRFRHDGSVLPRDHAPMAHALVTGCRVCDMELTVERPDRSRCTVLINIDVLRDARGHIVGAVNCFRDITEWQRMSAALHQTAALETLQRFAADVSHSWGNILAAVSSNLDMAKRRLSDPQVAKFVDRASLSAERGLEFARRLRDFAGMSKMAWDEDSLEAMLRRLSFSEPIREVADTAANPLPDQGAHENTVLLVDDDAILRAAAGDALGTLGFNVVGVESGEAALDVIRSDGALALMIVDIGMAPMNGIELLRRARTIRPEIRALVMTGRPELPSELDGGQPDTMVLKKPFSLDELSESLTRLIA